MLLQVLETVLSWQQWTTSHVSVSYLEEPATENIFWLLKNQLHNNVLLNTISLVVFKMADHGNIDQKEKTGIDLIQA